MRARLPSVVLDCVTWRGSHDEDVKPCESRAGDTGGPSSYSAAIQLRVILWKAGAGPQAPSGVALHCHLICFTGGRTTAISLSLENNEIRQ